MSSAVWVVVTVPHKDYESVIKEKEKLRDSLKLNGINRKGDNGLHTINEAINETLNNDSHNNYENKADKRNELPIETVLEDALSYLGVSDATWLKSKNGNFYQVVFPVETEESDAILQYLLNRGIGNKFLSSIGIIPFSLYYRDDDFEEINEIDEIVVNSDEFGKKEEVVRSLSNFKTQQNKFLKSVTARLTVAQVVDNVRSGATLTFDFVCYVIFASWIAAMGLLDNSVVSLVASMLVSPMMGPVMAMTFGAIIKDRSLKVLGIRNIMACFAMTILFGYIFGLICLNFTEEWNSRDPWPTNMMRERGLPRVVWIGTLVAFPSGCAVAISLLSANEASLVGVAIAVSLLPPAVNAGLLWAYSTLKTLHSIGQHYVTTNYTNGNSYRLYYLPPALTPLENYEPFYYDNMAMECATLGAFSILLSIINITNIIAGAFILLKIKEIAPLQTMSPETRRFFHEDIKIARNYNSINPNNVDNMGEELLKEWANIAGLDANQLLSDKPEARMTQMQTLADIARDVEADQTFQSIARKSMSQNSNLARRLSQTIQQASALNNNYAADDRRSSHLSSRSVFTNTVNTHLSMDTSAIASRRKSMSQSRRSSRNSQVFSGYLPTGVMRDSIDENYVLRDMSHRNSTSSQVRPSSPSPQSGNVFTFDNTGELRSTALERHRRRNSALRRSLHQSDHLPYSVWPSARMVAPGSPRLRPPGSPRFTVTPVMDRFLPEETDKDYS